MIERFFLALAALAGALVIGATAAYAVARPADRIGSGLTEPASYGPKDVTDKLLASIDPAQNEEL